MNKEPLTFDDHLLTSAENKEIQGDSKLDKNAMNNKDTNEEQRNHSIFSNHPMEFVDEYDYCIVFPMSSDGNLNEMGETIMRKIKMLGFNIFAFKNHNNREIFVLLRVPLEKLREFADSIDFVMQLDPKQTQLALKAGDPEHHIKGITIPENLEATKIKAYEYIYGRYSTSVPEILYYRPTENDTHPFRESIRLKLIALLLESIPPDRGEPLKIRRYTSRGDVIACFPLHSIKDLFPLQAYWLSIYILPWTIPIHEIKEYFSEKVALYFYFLGHISLWLIGPAFIGLPLQIAVFATNQYSAPYIPVYSFFIAIWAICTMEFWKRKEADIAMRWGMSNFEENEQDRSDFKGTRIQSYITGQYVKYFPRSTYLWYMCHSFTMIFMLILLVIGVVVAIYITRFTLTRKSDLSENDAQTVASILNAIQIQLMNFVYSTIAEKLVNYENHRTETQYEDSMIIKLFLFQFVNSYASFYYIAFIAEPLGECIKDECMQSLATNLGIIIASRVATGILFQQIVPYIQFKYSYHKEIVEYGNELLRPERERFLIPYDVRISSINEYASITIQFGYMALFVSALPAAALFVLISNIIEAKGDAWKLLHAYQRPFPYGCQDIGTWQSIYFLLTIASVITNAAITCFTMTTFDDFGNKVKFWIFVGFQWICFGIQFFLMELIPDIPDEVMIQLQRLKFIVSKLIDKEADDEITPFDLETINLRVHVNEYPQHKDDAQQFCQSKDHNNRPNLTNTRTISNPVHSSV